MKKAFTLLELVFVIVIIGILAAVIIPSTKTNPIREASIQLLADIRYTQHLAMVDDRFDVNDAGWYHELWQINFTTGGSASSNHKVAYAIFSDWKNTHTGHPERDELAKDPLTGKLITGGITNTVPYNDPDALERANLGLKYSVGSISFSSSCMSSGSKRIAFDHLGRPIKGNISSPTNSTTLVTAMKFITATCNITLFSVNNDENVTISIEPETGYTHITS